MLFWIICRIGKMELVITIKDVAYLVNFYESGTSTLAKRT